MVEGDIFLGYYLIMRGGWKAAWLKSVAGLSINLSAGWFAAVFIVPNFSPLRTLNDFAVLFYDLLFGSIFLLVTVLLEKRGQQ